MNMSLINSKLATQDISELIGAEIVAVNIDSHAKVNAKLNTAKQFLDHSFPLASGSHKDVSSYIVYYAHLLAFMNDGSQSGLRHPGQFVAISGQECEPSAIELRDNKTHVEIEFDPRGGIGSQDEACIEDIQLEVPAINASQWISLLHGVEKESG